MSGGRRGRIAEGVVHLKRPGGNREGEATGYCGVSRGMWTEDEAECTCDGCKFSARRAAVVQAAREARGQATPL